MRYIALRGLNEMVDKSGLLKGKRGVILGVANHRSIAFGIAKACHAAGAELALTWQGDALKKRVEPLAAELGAILAGHCDVTDHATIDAVFDEVKKQWGRIDFVVHAIAFSDKDQLDGRYIETTAENFSKTMLISCYSLTAIAQRAEKLMTDGGSMITLTYYGAEKWMPHYNVMGVAKAALEASVRYLAADLGAKNIRVNAVSAGPIKTLAASGIGDFRYILKWNEYNSPMRRTVTIEEVGDSALYLLSDLSRGVTGEVHHVDSGYHIVGMKRPDAPDITLGKDINGKFNEALQTKGASILSETEVTPGANHGETAFFNDTLLKLNNPLPDVLNDNAGPTGPGDVTWALQWDTSIAAGGDFLISKQKFLQVPEPSVLALISLGAVAYALHRRRQSQHGSPAPV